MECLESQHADNRRQQNACRYQPCVKVSPQENFCGKNVGNKRPERPYPAILRNDGSCQKDGEQPPASDMGQ